EGLLLRVMREQEPAILVELLGEGDDDVLAHQVDFVEALYGCVERFECRIELGNHLTNGRLGLLEARAHFWGCGACRDGSDATVHRKPERDDTLCYLVSSGLRVRDHFVQEQVHAHEVFTADVPVRLLAVHCESHKVMENRGQVLRDAGRALQVALRRGNVDLLGCHLKNPSHSTEYVSSLRYADSELPQARLACAQLHRGWMAG